MRQSHILTPELLLKAIQGERDAIQYYQQLISMAPSQEDYDLIADIYQDEVGHQQAFSQLYQQLTGNQVPALTPKTPMFRTFREGAKKAILDELDSYEMYRDIVLDNDDRAIQKVFFEALTDENEHATKFNYMFTKTLEKIVT